MIGSDCLQQDYLADYGVEGQVHEEWVHDPLMKSAMVTGQEEDTVPVGSIY